MSETNQVRSPQSSVLFAKKKFPLIYIVSLIIVAIVFTSFGVLGYRFLSKKPQCQKETQTYWTYQTFKDDFVKFDYPNEWTSVVRSGHIIDKETNTDFTGLYSIELQSPQKDYMFKVSIGPASVGGVFYDYDLNDPLILKSDYLTPSPSETYQLKNELLLHSVPYSDFVLGGILENLKRKNGELVGNLLIGQVTETNLRASEGIWNGFKYSFLRGTGTVFGEATASGEQNQETNLACPMKTMTDFDKCAEFIDTFFGTVKKVD